MTFCHMQQNSQNLKCDSKVEKETYQKSLKNAPNILANPWTPLHILSKYKTSIRESNMTQPFKSAPQCRVGFLGCMSQVWIRTWSLLSM